MPFTAEAIYKGVGAGEKRERSYGRMGGRFAKNEKIKNQNEKLLEEMEEVRKKFRLGWRLGKSGDKSQTAARFAQNQNQKSKIKNKEELLKLIKDELNVKEVIFDEKIANEVDLDTEITPELKEEGDLRELVRGLQDLRKKAGLNPGQKITLLIQAEIQAREFMEKFAGEIKKSANIEKLEFNDKVEDGQEISADGFVIKAKIEA